MMEKQEWKPRKNTHKKSRLSVKIAVKKSPPAHRVSVYAEYQSARKWCAQIVI